MIYPDTFNNERRFIFNNWSNADFSCNWGGVPQLVKSGESKEFNMALAYHMTKHFVNQEMFKLCKDAGIASDEERKPFEERTLAEITANTDSPGLSELKSRIESEIVESSKGGKIKKQKKEVKKELEGTDREFADIK